MEGENSKRKETEVRKQAQPQPLFPDMSKPPPPYWHEPYSYQPPSPPYHEQWQYQRNHRRHSPHNGYYGNKKFNNNKRRFNGPRNVAPQFHIGKRKPQFQRPPSYHPPGRRQSGSYGYYGHYYPSDTPFVIPTYNKFDLFNNWGNLGWGQVV